MTDQEIMEELGKDKDSLFILLLMLLIPTEKLEELYEKEKRRLENETVYQAADEEDSMLDTALEQTKKQGEKGYGTVQEQNQHHA